MTPKPNSPPPTLWHFPALTLALTALTIHLGYFADRNHFPSFITTYTAFFALYIWACFYQTTIPTKHLVALGIALRLLLLFSLPNLSDDYFRFLWDGRLTIAGYHPFLHPPSYFIDNQILPPGITAELFSQLNSPNYYSVYPPVCQAVFAGATAIAPESNWVGVFVMKLFLLACEIATLAALAAFGGWRLAVGSWPLAIGRFHAWAAKGMKGAWGKIRDLFTARAKGQRPTAAQAWNPPMANSQEPRAANSSQQAAALYALNPLLILEIVGNCHFEGAMIFFLVAGIVAMREGKVVKPAIYWALATASKMLPLLFLPIVWRWLGWRKGLVFNGVFAVATLILFAPLIAVLPNIAQSIGLYFQKFQFNASVYYLVREVGYSNIGWDIGEVSGPWMGVATVLGVLVMALLVKRKPGPSEARLAGAMLFALMLYLSFSAVVQPWYVCVPLAISLFTRWRFAVLWSGMVALSYSHYDNGLRQEHFELIALEYGALWAFLGWEIWRYWKA